MSGTSDLRQGPAAVEAPVGDVGGRPAGYGSDRILELLRGLGHRYLPMNPGSSFRGLHDSIVNHGGNRDPQLLLCHNEQIAVSLAHGYAKAAQRCGAAVVHDLVGLMQASMGVYNAFVDEVPLLLLGGGGPADTRERRPIDWIHAASSQNQLVRDFVKWDAGPVDLPGTEEAIAQAARLAATEPAGPTYVTLDAAVQEQPLGSADAQRSPVAAGATPTGLTIADDEAEDLARALVGAEQPVIVVGPMGYAPAATRAVVALAEVLGAPCLDVDHATVVPTEHPANLTGDPTVVREADLIIALGVRDLRVVVERVIGRRIGSVIREGLPDVTIVDVGLRDLTLRGWSDRGATSPRVDRRVLADPVRAAESIATAAADLVSTEPAERGRRRDERRAAVAAAHATIAEAGRATVAARWDDPVIAPARLVAELWEVVRGEPWVLAMRNTRTFPRGVWRFGDANDYLGHSGGAGVGYGPGAMVGAGLGAAETDRLAVGIGGDGDLLMHPGALWTAAHYRVPMLYVINDNSSFYNDEDHQVAVARDRGWPEENGHIGMRMEDPKIDIAALARAYGVWASGPIEEPGELQAALRSGLEVATSGAPALVHVRTAPT